MSKNRNLSFETTILRYDAEDNETEITLTVEASWTAGCPAVMYLRNGDPGYPAEPDEVEITSVTDENGIEIELSESEMEKVTEKAYEEADTDYSDCD